MTRWHRHQWTNWRGPYDIQPYSDALFKIRNCKVCPRRQVAKVRGATSTD